VELTNEFSVKVPVDVAWSVLVDLERVAPCMPGFELKEIDGDEYHGVVKVKVGPMVAQYKGVGSFVERDDAGHRAVIRAEGREARGQGNAAATVTATLEPEGEGTHVTLVTDLKITGKVAQFGRGVLADVSNKLLKQFVEALEADVLASMSAAATPAPAAATGVTGAPEASAERSGAQATAVAAPPARAEAEPVDLIAAAGGSVMKRVVGPLVAAAIFVAVLIYVLL